MAASVAEIWKLLEREATQQPHSAERVYRALGASAVGVRAGYLPASRVLELLIEVPGDWPSEPMMPAWRGMGHEVVALALPPRISAQHLRLFSVGSEYHDVFILVCDDLVEALEGVSDVVMRMDEIENWLVRWRSFFERSGMQGLSAAQQQGLFAELTWLHHLLQANISPVHAVTAWKGCERAYHDFDLEGRVIEVKCTRTKEPRSVFINNERQLDNNGLKSLHLFVVSVHEIADGGITLPDMVETVRASLRGSNEALVRYRNGLTSAGYLERDAKRYTQQRIVKAEDLFEVVEGFPRITRVPPGIGDVSYRLFLGSCEPHRAELSEYLLKTRMEL